VDLLLIYTPTRDVFVNMSSLTGEKDPVQRKVPNRLEISSPGESPLCGVLYTTAPVPDLDTFYGELCIGTERYACSAENLVLAGTVLLKGKNVYGVVVATGSDTKVNQKKDMKRTAFSCCVCCCCCCCCCCYCCCCCCCCVCVCVCVCGRVCVCISACVYVQTPLRERESVCVTG
jgi:hypothetical protein